MDKKNDLYCTGRGEGRLGSDSNSFQYYSNSEASNIIATNQVSTLFYDPNEEKFCAIGKNPDKMFSLSSSSMSNEEHFKSHTSGIRQISISNAHVLVLYGDKSLYASPDSKKELFGTWVEGSEGHFSQILLPDYITQVHKILALNNCSIMLCTNGITLKKVLYSFGLPSAPGVGQGDKPVLDSYQKLAYPEYLFKSNLTIL